MKENNNFRNIFNLIYSLTLIFCLFAITIITYKSISDKNTILAFLIAILLFGILMPITIVFIMCKNKMFYLISLIFKKKKYSKTNNVSKSSNFKDTTTANVGTTNNDCDCKTILNILLDREDYLFKNVIEFFGVKYNYKLYSETIQNLTLETIAYTWCQFITLDPLRKNIDKSEINYMFETYINSSIAFKTTFIKLDNQEIHHTIISILEKYLAYLADENMNGSILNLFVERIESKIETNEIPLNVKIEFIKTIS